MERHQPDEGAVTYSVKELFDNLARELDKQFSAIAAEVRGVSTKLDGKADAARVSDLEKAHKDLAERVNALELAEAGVKAVSKYRTVALTIAASWVLVVIALTVLIVTKGHA